MLIGRHAYLSLLAGLALSSVACSQVSSPPADENTAADSNQSVDASSLITVNAALPFEVKRMHPATGRIFNARWGQHGGPVATLSDDAAHSPSVTRWWIPNAPNSPAAAQPLASALPSDMPKDTDSFYWNNDGFLDTPDGALMAWSSTSGNFMGELLQYSTNYENVVSRAWVNGYYSGANVDSRLVYSGLSGITADAAPETSECGLWGSDITPTSLVPATTSTHLIKWAGASGPVATDNNGNVFVAAFVTGGAHSEEIYGLAKSQALASEPQTPTTLAQADNGGTSSIAAASIPGSNTGWIFAKGWDAATAQPVYARQYTTTADAVAVAGDTLVDAIKPVLASSTISLFTDPKGNLWVTVTAEAGAWLIELEPKQP